MTTTQLVPPPEAIRFDALDALRGLAAMAVVIDHITHQSRLHGAWTVVDMFFMLSGFVLCHTHADKITQGRQGFASFMWSRIHRLGPLYWIACGMGAIVAGLATRYHPELRIDGATLAKALLSSVLMLPNFGETLWPHGDSIRGALLFPLNPPAWTTFFQLVVNVGFFAALTRLRTGWKLPMAMATLVALNWMEWHVDSINPGWGQGNFLMGWPRAFVEFGVGVALYRAHRRVPLLPPALALLPAAAFMLSFLAPSQEVQLLSVVVLAPLAIVAAARTHVPARLVGICQRLGDLSYPLYISHMPVWGLVLIFMPRHGWPGWAQTLATFVAAILCAAVLVPIERALRNRLPKA